MEGKWKPKKRANRNGWGEKKSGTTWRLLGLESFHESYKKEKQTGTKERTVGRSTRWKLDLIAVYAVGMYFQTIVKRVGAILTGHSDALTDSPKTKVATKPCSRYRCCRRNTSFALFSLSKIERFDSIERDGNWTTKKKKGWGGKKKKKENEDEVTQLHAPRGKCKRWTKYSYFASERARGR